MSSSLHRVTRQRAAILDTLAEANRPLAPREVLDGAGRRVPKLGIATVYRTLNAFVDEGLAVAVALPGTAPRYETAGRGHHHHFHCHQCDRVFDVPGCPGTLRTLTPRGFSLDAHDIVLYGRCDHCRAT